MVSFVKMLQSCKIDGVELLGTRRIEQICHQVGHQWREGKLPPATTVQCVMEQMAAGNVSCGAVRQMHGGEFTGEAFSQARQRLPRAVLEELNRGVSAAVIKLARDREARHGRSTKGRSTKGRRKGRVFIVDGSSLTMPDTPELREHFGLRANQPEGCSYPTCHLLLQTGPGGAATEAICSPYRTGDMTHVNRTQGGLEPGDIVLGDRLFCTWGHFWSLSQRGACGVFHAHHSRPLEFGKYKEHGPNRRFVRKLGYKDQLVEYRKPRQRPKWMSQEEFAGAPEWMMVREVRVKVKIKGRRKTVTLVTTLLDPQAHEPRELVELMGWRWTIETDLRHLKTTMGLEQLRCKTVEGVKKELAAYLLVYNVVRLVMLHAAWRQEVQVCRVSFADTLAWVRHHPASAAGLCDLLINPARPGRIEPRVVKQRKKPFAYMTRPREQLRQEILATRVAA